MSWVSQSVFSALLIASAALAIAPSKAMAQTGLPTRGALDASGGGSSGGSGGGSLGSGGSTSGNGPLARVFPDGGGLHWNLQSDAPPSSGDRPIIGAGS